MCCAMDLLMDITIICNVHFSFSCSSAPLKWHAAYASAYVQNASLTGVLGVSLQQNIFNVLGFSWPVQW